MKLMFLTALILFLASFGLAGQPIEPTDVELAESPIIVVGYWQKMEPYVLPGTSRKVQYFGGPFTKLIVTKVIKGDVKVGETELMVSGSIMWKVDGSFLNSNSSSMSISYIKDITKPNLWFIKRSKLNESDKVDHLHIYSQRCIQSEKFLPYYQTLGRSDRETTIKDCLLGNDSDIVERALEFVNGSRCVWPEFGDPTQDGPDTFGINKRPPGGVIGQIQTLQKMMANPESKCRSFATSVYAEMLGSSAIQYIRPLLSDANSTVRLTAAAWLVRFGDLASSKPIYKACQGTSKPDLICELIYAMQKSGRKEYVPTIIDYLDTNTTGGAVNSNWRIPSLYARKALQIITSVTFPLDTRKSRAAWETAIRKSSNNPKSVLLKMLGSIDDPLEITCTPVLNEKGKLIVVSKKEKWDTGEKILVRLTIVNRTKVAITILGEPSSVSLRSKEGFGIEPSPESDRHFVTIVPSGTYRIDIPFRTYGSQKFDVEFCSLSDGRKAGKKAWMGVVKSTLLVLCPALTRDRS